MEPYLNPTAVTAVLAVAVISVRTIVDIRTLMSVPARKEHITRAEYEKDERLRKEQHLELAIKCRNNARRQTADRRRNDAKFDQLVEGLADLRVQLARLATVMEERETPKDRRVQVVTAQSLSPANVKLQESPKESV